MKGRLIKRESNYYLFVEGKPFGTTDDLYLQYEIVNKLSKQNCDEIFGVVDVEKLAEDDWDIYGEQFKNTPIWDYKEIFVAGFNKAMELNKYKVFTLEQMNKAIRLACSEYSGNIIDEVTQQPTEIEVEIECHTIKQTKVYGAIKGVKGSGHKITTSGYAPKLDANNNLILRRI
jgi:hypothetical protein